ncbi:MAG: DUF2769 domain-containing protein [Actinobacteria bacterium]|nr:DUF2769 domain-containing protein [Actinomycetota bacterium]
MATVPDSAENAVRCVCGECPSKPAELKSFYCARGAGGSAVQHRGCLCGECPLTGDYDLWGDYYCESGAAS